jgi:hypothetical protein
LFFITYNKFPFSALKFTSDRSTLARIDLNDAKNYR